MVIEDQPTNIPISWMKSFYLKDFSCGQPPHCSKVDNVYPLSVITKSNLGNLFIMYYILKVTWA